jgi:hypothetical protein
MDLHGSDQGMQDGPEGGPSSQNAKLPEKFLDVPYDDRWEKLEPVILQFYLEEKLRLDALVDRMKVSVSCQVSVLSPTSPSSKNPQHSPLHPPARTITVAMTEVSSKHKCGAFPDRS